MSKNIDIVSKTSIRLDRKEQIRLALLYQQNGCQKALESLIGANIKLVTKIAHKHKRQGIELEDLISEGITGIIHSLNLYDPSKGASFTSFAANWIRARIQEYIQNNCTTIRVGTRTAKRLYASLPRLRREHGENLTIETIAQELNLKPSDVAATIEFLSKKTLDLNHKPNADSRELNEVIGDPQLSIETLVIQNERNNVIRKLCKDFNETLNQRESYIYQHRIQCILEDCNRTPASQLSEYLNITKQRISQIEKQLKQRLANFIKSADIG